MADSLDNDFRRAIAAARERDDFAEVVRLRLNFEFFRGVREPELQVKAQQSLFCGVGDSRNHTQAAISKAIGEAAVLRKDSEAAVHHTSHPPQDTNTDKTVNSDSGEAIGRALLNKEWLISRAKSLEKNMDRYGDLYVISTHGADGMWVKLGRSGNVKARLASIRQGAPMLTMTLEGSYRGLGYLESRCLDLATRLAKRRGEWFKSDVKTILGIVESVYVSVDREVAAISKKIKVIDTTIQEAKKATIAKEGTTEEVDSAIPSDESTVEKDQEVIEAEERAAGWKDAADWMARIVAKESNWDI